MKKTLLALALATCLTGCLEVCRPWMPHGPYFLRGMDPDGSKYCITNNWSCYPCVWMRYAVTKNQIHMNEVNDPDYNGWGWIGITAIWITIPLDGIADTILMPWDLYYYYNERKPPKNVELH